MPADFGPIKPEPCFVVQYVKRGTACDLGTSWLVNVPDPDAAIHEFFRWGGNDGHRVVSITPGLTPISDDCDP